MSLRWAHSSIGASRVRPFKNWPGQPCVLACTHCELITMLGVYKRATVLGILISIAGCFVGCVSQPHDSEPEMLLSLPWQQFDQTLNSGWRLYLARHECRAAADLI